MSKVIEAVINMGLQDKKYTGKLLWWSKRDGNGIICLDENEDGFAVGSEIYFDSSVLKDSLEDFPRDAKLEFIFNTNIIDCLCAKDVKLIK